MSKTIVVFGSSTGTCEGIADKIAAKLGVEALNVQDLTSDIVAANDNLILGTSTWGAGEMQDDWYDGVKVLQGADLKGKTIASSVVVMPSRMVTLLLEVSVNYIMPSRTAVLNSSVLSLPTVITSVTLMLSLMASSSVFHWMMSMRTTRRMVVSTHG